MLPTTMKMLYVCLCFFIVHLLYLFFHKVDPPSMQRVQGSATTHPRSKCCNLHISHEFYGLAKWSCQLHKERVLFGESYARVMSGSYVDPILLGSRGWRSI